MLGLSVCAESEMLLVKQKPCVYFFRFHEKGSVVFESLCNCLLCSAPSLPALSQAFSFFFHGAHSRVPLTDTLSCTQRRSTVWQCTESFLEKNNMQLISTEEKQSSQLEEKRFLLRHGTQSHHELRSKSRSEKKGRTQSRILAHCAFLLLWANESAKNWREQLQQFMLSHP